MSIKEELDKVESEYLAKQKKKKKKMLISVGVVLVVGVILFFLSTGLNDRRVVKLNADVTQLTQSNALKDQEIANLKQAITDTTVTEVAPETSIQRVEGTEIPEFWFRAGGFVAPNKLTLPNTSEDINNTAIQLGSRFKFSPSERWVLKSKGTTLEVAHPERIWGTVKALAHKERLGEDQYKVLLQGFFKGYPKTTVTYRNVYIEDNVVGMMARANLTIKDSKGVATPMILNVGFAQRGDHSLVWMFLHDSKSANGQELIDLLLRSGQYGESKLKLE